MVIGAPRHDRATVRSVQLVALSARTVMVVVVLSNGTVENETIELAEEISELRVNAASSVLQRAYVGRSFDSAAVVDAGGDAEVAAVCAAAVEALHRTSPDEAVFVSGASSMARAFDAVETVRQVLDTLEQQYVVVSLVRDIVNKGLTVAIGAEHGVQPLSACSVVIAPVVVDGDHVGTIGVLGPTRMDYPQALATVDVVSERLGRRLSDGG